MTDGEFADWLRSVPRELPPEGVMASGDAHDRLDGPWVGHETVHHNYGESGQQ